MVICLSPGGQTITVGELAKEMLLVGTARGIFSFVRQGSWRPKETLLPERKNGAF